MMPSHHGKLTGGGDQLGDDEGADRGHVADRQVDLGQEQHRKISAAPNRMKTAAWTNRLTRLPADRNFDCSIWKKMTITTSPTRIGSAPLSPLRIRRPQARKYSPSESARTSGATAGQLGLVEPPDASVS